MCYKEETKPVKLKYVVDKARYEVDEKQDSEVYLCCTFQVSLMHLHAELMCTFSGVVRQGRLRQSLPSRPPTLHMQSIQTEVSLD